MLSEVTSADSPEEAEVNKEDQLEAAVKQCADPF